MKQEEKPTPQEIEETRLQLRTTELYLRCALYIVWGILGILVIFKYLTFGA